MAHNDSAAHIIGTVVERKPTANGKPFSSRNASGSTSTGFPSVQHRSKSAFARNREETQRRSGAVVPSQSPPVLVPARTRVPPSLPPSSKPPATHPGDWREQISKDNEDRVASMTEEDREEERKHIIERFGAGIGSVLEKAKRNRMKQSSDTIARGDHSRNGITIPQPEPDSLTNTAWQDLQEVPISPEERKPNSRASPPPPALSTSSTVSSRPSSRADRRIRFAELAPSDVYVYESTPPSPRKPFLALPPPGDDDNDAVSLGRWKGRMTTNLSPSADTIPEADNPKPDGHPSESRTNDGSKLEERETNNPQSDPETVMVEGLNENSAGNMDVDPEEGSPEYIRRRYFPDLPVNDPNLAWMTASPSTSTTGLSSIYGSSLRFDLRGAPIPPKLSSTLPSHLGLHHHAEGSHAGYTLDDIFLLSRSTVPAQRSTMLGLLSGIARRLGKLAKGDNVDGMEELVGKEEDLRRRIVAAGVEAMNDRGSVGVLAIEVVWECLVGWDEELVGWGLDGIELESPSDAAIRSLPLDFIASSIATTFSQYREAMPRESLLQLLEITQRLALQNSDNAQKIVATDKLIPGVLQTFLLTPIPPPPDGSSLPEPSAITLLTTLANASRANADILAKDYADALLRFITFVPSSSLFPSNLASTLLSKTLAFYSSLASYGYYSHIASTAMDQFAKLGQYILSQSCISRAVMSAWARLIETWTVCAIDPHVTTPSHDILWSRIVGWGWHHELTQLSERLSCDDNNDWNVWGDVWNALAAWLEGSRLNSVRGGESERSELVAKVKEGFESGREGRVVLGVLDAWREDLGKPSVGDLSQMKAASRYVGTLAGAIRLWLACLPPHLDGAPSAPPFNLPFDRISEASAKLLSHPTWTLLSVLSSSYPPSFSSSTRPTLKTTTPRLGYNIVYIRHFSSFLSTYLRLSRRLPGIPRDLWLAQAFSITSRFMPGDEQYALATVRDLLKLTPAIQPTLDIIWASKGGSAVLEPFMEYLILPHAKVELPSEDGVDASAFDEVTNKLGPLTPTPQSIKTTTTLTLAASPAHRNTPRSRTGLPLHRDWSLSALDHLLYSGDSPIFKNLPTWWDYSEIDVAQASFAFTISAREVLRRFGLTKFALGRGEATLGCMKVFMLEHRLVDVREKASEEGLEEVFRDKTVERLMGMLLNPYQVGSSSTNNLAQETTTEDVGNDNLEKLATHFLGFNTPFYQFYTDFLGLYDAISFSHPVFALLLLPPLSMHYPVDYRKLFWCDYSHTLRTIAVYPEQVISGDLREYLYPVETNPQVIAGYLSALLNENAKGFLRWVAIHHVAANIWGDNQDETYSDDRAGKLLKAVINQGGHGAVRDVVKYYQGDDREKEAVIPPNCFLCTKNVLENRRKLATKLIGNGYFARLEGLFEES